MTTTHPPTLRRCTHAYRDRDGQLRICGRVYRSQQAVRRACCHVADSPCGHSALESEALPVHQGPEGEWHSGDGRHCLACLVVEAPLP
jgi:hypothetical protein